MIGFFFYQRNAKKLDKKEMLSDNIIKKCEIQKGNQETQGFQMSQKFAEDMDQNTQY